MTEGQEITMNIKCYDFTVIFKKKNSVRYHNFVDFLNVIFLQAIAPPISQLDLQLQLADVYNN